jgi:hypothetical protein
MARYRGVNGVAREVTKRYRGVDGVAREITKGYRGVNGVAREYFSSGTPVSTLAVGSSVWLNVNGTLTEFLVVHQGRPSTLYHSSCNGTWLLMKDIYGYRQFGYSNNRYAGSAIASYLDGAFLQLLSTTVQSAIKQVRIPYVKGSATAGHTVASGSSGLSTKVFLLGGCELGFTSGSSSIFPVDGAKLDYFISGDTTAAGNKRVANDSTNGRAAAWMLRSLMMTTDVKIYSVNYLGGLTGSMYNDSTLGVRPAFILDSNTTFDNSTGKNIIA